MDKKLLIFILGMFFLSLVSAGATLDQSYTLSLSCEGYTCADVNVSVLFPNSTLFIDNQETTDNIYYATYILKPTIRGNYIYYYSDGTNSSEGVLAVTATGNELNQAQAFLYFLIAVVLIGLFIFSLVGASNLEYKNKRNQEGDVIDVNWKKYLKVFGYLSSYMLLLAIVFVTWNLIYAYSDWYALSNFFHYIFRLLYLFALPVLIGVIVIGLANAITDKKINKFIQKTGLPYKEV